MKTWEEMNYKELKKYLLEKKKELCMLTDEKAQRDLTKHIQMISQELADYERFVRETRRNGNKL